MRQEHDDWVGQLRAELAAVRAELAALRDVLERADARPGPHWTVYRGAQGSRVAMVGGMKTRRRWDSYERGRRAQVEALIELGSAVGCALYLVALVVAWVRWGDAGWLGWALWCVLAALTVVAVYLLAPSWWRALVVARRTPSVPPREQP